MPWVGAVSPHMTLNRVDLPAPLGPSRAVTPARTKKLTSDTATTSPNTFDTLFTSTMAEPSGGGGGGTGGDDPVGDPGGGGTGAGGAGG